MSKLTSKIVLFMGKRIIYPENLHKRIFYPAKSKKE